MVSLTSSSQVVLSEVVVILHLGTRFGQPFCICRPQPWTDGVEQRKLHNCHFHTLIFLMCNEVVCCGMCCVPLTCLSMETDQWVLVINGFVGVLSICSWGGYRSLWWQVALECGCVPREHVVVVTCEYSWNSWQLVLAHSLFV